MAVNEAGGIRTPTRRIKSPVCCRYTTTPSLVGDSVSNDFSPASLCSSVISRVARDGIEPPPPLYQNDMLPLHHRAAKVGREALESSSAVLQTAAKPSQLPTQRKKARCLGDTGLSGFPNQFLARRHQRKGIWAIGFAE